MSTFGHQLVYINAGLANQSLHTIANEAFELKSQELDALDLDEISLIQLKRAYSGMFLLPVSYPWSLGQ